MSKSVTLTEPDSMLEEPVAAAIAVEAGFSVCPASKLHVVRRPEDLPLPPGQAIGSVRVDPSELIITEAPFLNEAEVNDACEALVEDEIFESPEWTGRYLNKDFPLHDGETLQFDPPALIRTGITFGWAIEQAARIARSLSTDCSESQIEVALELPTPVTPHEHLFIGLELQRRGVHRFALQLPWGGRWEPGVDWIGELETFGHLYSVHSSLAAQHGGWSLSFDHAEQKFSVLPLLSARTDGHLRLRFDGWGWTAATRILCRKEPELFREILIAAQDRFAFDKPNAELATTEDDIRTLPDVPDSELERVFVEDFRGRQMLHVTARSLLNDDQMGTAIRALVQRHRSLLSELVAADARRHLAPWLPSA